MRVVIGSTNRAKAAGIQEAFCKIFGECEFVQVEVYSGVSFQPSCEEEGTSGALTRARNASKIENADYFVGAEGYVSENEHGMFCGGCVAIIDKDNRYGIGYSGRVMIPRKMREAIKEGRELGLIIEEIEKNSRQSSGVLGILTKGNYTRISSYRHATYLALARFISQEHGY